MSTPTDKTELHRLIKERDTTLAYLTIYKATEASFDGALQRITKEGQPNPPKDNERVISSLSVFIRTRARPSNQHSQTNRPYRTGSSADGDRASPPQPTELAYRERETLSAAKGRSNLSRYTNGRGRSAAGSQGESHDDDDDDDDDDDSSFVMVENFEEKSK